MLILMAAILSALASAPTMSLSVTTVDRDGRPVAGADIWLVGLAGSDDAPIVVQGRSDEQGHFALTLPAGLAGRGDYRPATLWAMRAGMRVALLRFPGSLPDPGRPVRLELGPPAGAEIRVVDPDGAPVAGASIRLYRIHPNELAVPDPIAGRLEQTTDAAGRFVLDAFASEDLASIQVRARGFGSQPRAFRPPTGGPKIVRLRPAAKVSGRLVGGDPDLVRGWKVSALTAPSDGLTARDGYWVGEADTTSDDEGRFEIPAIAAGSLTLTCRPPAGVPYRAENLSAALHAGQDNPVTVNVRRAVRLEGVYRDRQTAAPIPGVRLHVFFQKSGSSESIVTDDQGGFSQLVLPGDVTVNTATLPKPYVNTPAVGGGSYKVPAGVDRFVVEPFEVNRAAPPLRGVALDESGRPVAGAAIRGTWEMTEEGRGGVYLSAAMADAQGHFALEDLAPDVAVKVSARHRELATTEPVAARAGQTEAVTLRLARSATAAIRGRVLGPGGRPIPGALVKVHYQRQTSFNSRSGGFVTFEAEKEIRTAADGTFQTPRELLRADEYRVEALADGLIAGMTDWTRLAPGDVTPMPDIVLMKTTGLRAVAGRVVDRRGDPIADADVLQAGDGPSPTKARTDSQGRFLIRGVAEGPAFLFARKPGHRFAGRMIDAGSAPVELVLDRSDEPPRTLRQPAAWPMPRAEERAIARKLLEPALAATQEPDLAYLRQQAIAAMARVDPGRVLEMLEDRVVPPGQGGQRSLDQVAVGLLEEGPRQALDVIESDQDPASRISGYLALFKAAAGPQRDFRRDLLERALAESRRVEDPGAKSTLLAQVGDGWRELGDLDQAAPVLRNARALFARADQPQYAWIPGLAPALAVVDLPSALAIAEGPDHSRVQHYPDAVKMELGEMAWRIAATQPAEAERLLGRMDGPTAYARDASTLRACRSMAPVDLERATRIAATLRQPPYAGQPQRPTLVLYAHAVMADALAASDAASARRMIDETMAQLRRIAREDPSRSESLQAAGLLAGCLAIVERIDPARLEECLWEAIACRPSRSDEPDLQQVRALAIEAAFVARYDPTAAEVIARPIFEHVSALAIPRFGDGNVWGLKEVFKALACVDPRRAAALTDQLPADRVIPKHAPAGYPGGQPTFINTRTNARVALAEMLGWPIDRRRREMGNLVVNPWLLGESP
jgi:protocatechuate 3,4-dioxygenase beta subunit